MMLAQTCQIISGPALTKQWTKRQTRYKCKKTTVDSVMFYQVLDVLKACLAYR